MRALIAILLIFLITPAFSLILPGSPLYGLKRAIEKITLFLTFDKEGKIKKHLQFAENRIKEIEKLAEMNRTEFLEDLVKEYEGELQKAKEYLKEINKTDALELALNKTTTHLDVLSKVYEIVPEPAKEAILLAMEASTKGADTIADLLEDEREAEFRTKIMEKYRERVRKCKEEKCARFFADKIIEQINKTEEIARRINKTEVIEKILNATLHHIEVLERIYEIVPEQAKPAILHAINVSNLRLEKLLEKTEEVDRNLSLRFRLRIAEKEIEKVRECLEENDTECVRKHIERYGEVAKIGEEEIKEIIEEIENKTEIPRDITERLEERLKERMKENITEEMNITVPEMPEEIPRRGPRR